MRSPSLTYCRLPLLALLAMTSAISHAAAPWPARPIRVVLPYAAGSSGDVVFRKIQPSLEKELGTTMFLENKGGASGNIGASDVARSAPDGYTFLLGATNNYVINQYLFTLPFDPLKDLVPVTMVVNSPLVVMVNPSLPINTLADLAAFAKKNADKINFGSPGLGTTPHLAGMQYAQLSGAPLTHVPYRGGSLAAQATISNEVQAVFMTADSTAGYVLTGRVRGIAVAGTERLKALPDVPTTAEAGLPSFLAGNWWGLSAPKGTDPDIVAKMAAAVKKAVTTPAIVEEFAQQGTIVVGNRPAEFAAQLAQEAATWKAMIEKANIKIQ